MKCLYLSLQQTSASLWSTPIQNDSILFTNGREEEDKTSRTLRRLLRQRSHCPVFSPSRSLSPPSLFAESQESLGLKVLFFLMIDFHVDVISKLCLWLSLFVFDWSTQHVGFSKDHGRSHWLSCWKEIEESAVSMERGREKKRARERERKKQPPPSSLTSPLVEVCVYVCVHVSVCFFVPIDSKQRPPSEMALVRYVLRLCIWDTSVWEGFFCVLSSSSLSSLSPCLLITTTPDPPSPSSPVPLPLPPNTPLKRGKKLVHSWFGKKRLNKKTNKNV